MPWVDARLVEIIRAPDDFDRKLKWESMKRARENADSDPALKEALEKSVDQPKKRHFEQQAKEMLLLSAPDDYLRQVLKEQGLEKDEFTADDFIADVQRMRDRNANFLEPVDQLGAQVHMMSAGATHEIGCLTANITKSYLVTDIYAKWYQIESDRDANNPETRVWTKARTESDFDEANAALFAEELQDEVTRAESEWDQIDQDLRKMVRTEMTAGLLAAGSLIAAGHGKFLAAAGALAGTFDVAQSTLRRMRFPMRHPAAFLMQIDAEKTEQPRPDSPIR